jgi:hypothetical protein
MKRGLLIGGGVIGAVLVVVVVAAVLLVSNLGTLIKKGVETYGSEVVQAKVTLDKADVSATTGEGALKGLTVGNPKGFTTPSAFRLGSVSVKLDTGTLTKDVIVVKEVIVAAPEVTYEIAAQGSNIDAIQKNVNAYMAKFGSGKSEAKKSEGPKIIIENLYIRDGKANVSATALQGKTLSANLPAIHLKDIGKEKKGAAPEEVVQTVVASLSVGAAKAVQTLDLGKALGAAGAAAGDVKKALEDSAGKTIKGLEGSGQKAGDQLKKLFGQ